MEQPQTVPEQVAPQLNTQTPSVPPTSGHDELDSKDQKSFERWRKTLSVFTGIGLTPEEFQAEVDKADKKNCELHKEQLIKNSPGIRAAALSGDCNWTREVRRGFYTFTKQHQECVKRRAILSVQANPNCPSRAAAEKAVNAVFESCYNDTRPFDEFY
ncbi:Mitochondrial inner membrane protease atp23 [Entomortierella lignicola]|nr:Mitochondrial inner membrane protease atp23 [Entomortierella lignicola]